MIVVDTNIVAYLYLQGGRTQQSEALLRKRPLWAAPMLWRSEFRSVLSLYLRKRLLELDTALAIAAQAEELLRGREYTVASFDVMSLVADSPCSAYDCEFVALARHLDTVLVTADRKVLKAFPGLAVPPETFTSF